MRSNRTKDDDIYVEMTMVDLELKYGSTEAGRPGACFSRARVWFFQLFPSGFVISFYSGNTWTPSRKPKKVVGTPAKRPAAKFL